MEMEPFYHVSKTIDMVNHIFHSVSRRLSKLFRIDSLCIPVYFEGYSYCTRSSHRSRSLPAQTTCRFLGACKRKSGLGSETRANNHLV